MLSFLETSVTVTFVYAAVLALYAAVMGCLAIVEATHRRRQDLAEAYESMLASAFSIPGSIIAPSFNEEVMAVPVLRSLLAQAYPTTEVIAVDDGSTDGTLAAMIEAFDLEPRRVFYRTTLATKPVRMVYRSRTEPRLTVVSKENGGKADALNCGVNFARYRVLCCVDGDTMFAPDAVLKAMTVISRDPARIVGAASFFGISLTPETIGEPTYTGPTTNDHLLGDFQHLDMMRAFVDYRAAWSRMECMMCVSGGYGMWRRDVVVEVGGFSPKFTCEDIEMTFRVHERMLREKRPYRIVSLPNLVAQTEGPSKISRLVSQRARWQRVTLETIWEYRRMFLRPSYRKVGMLGVPYYALFECLAPLFQVVSLVTLLLAIVFGVLGWQSYLAFLGLMAFGTALPTTLAVALHDRGYRDYRIRDLVRMILLGPLDLFLYRPILMWAGLVGVWEWMRGDKRWNKFDRNHRPRAAAVATA
jgi:cellulose synthase/poly-beta-1,6-N-acetylglucosamine synthase-like glycosyltransferase